MKHKMKDIFKTKVNWKIWSVIVLFLIYLVAVYIIYINQIVPKRTNEMCFIVHRSNCGWEGGSSYLEIFSITPLIFLTNLLIWLKNLVFSIGDLMIKLGLK